jgi:hypothetical protein
MPDPIDDGRQLIQSRLANISAEARQLERALVGLGERTVRKRRRGRPRGSAPALTRAPKRKRAPRKPKRAKRAARGQRREELLAAIKAKPGVRPSELAKEMGVRPTQVSILIAKARAENCRQKRRGLRAEGQALISPPSEPSGSAPCTAPTS